MNKQSIEQLKSRFSFQNDLASVDFIEGQGNIPVVEIKSPIASAKISLQGAHILSWVPKGKQEVIWLSNDARFAEGKSLRGGVPLCWPWFGAHRSNNEFPAHGFARTVFWQLSHSQLLASGEIVLIFLLDTTQLAQEIQAMWDVPSELEYKVVIGESLKLSLTTTNKSESSICIGQALHTYFSIYDISKVQVKGLHGVDYLDKTDSFKRKTQQGPLDITGEVDRVYIDTKHVLTIDDSIRKITIKKQGSDTSVVWNPWQAVAEKMGDLGPQGYKKMLCVESANAMDDVITIEPGQQHCMAVEYSV